MAELEASEALFARIHGELVADGVLIPLAFGGADEQSWSDCDLASFAEGRLGDLTDPRVLDATTRAAWSSTALDEQPRPPSARTSWQRSFWIADAGARVGTLALAASGFHSGTMSLSSLYVFPDHRRRGHAKRIVRAVCARCAAHGQGVVLDTYWTWQRAVRLYLDLGFWLRHWKRELYFEWIFDLPRPRLAISDRDASISILDEGKSIVLARAHRDGDRLVLTGESVPERFERLSWHAPTTLSLAVAVRGWPLIRDKPERGWMLSDAVHPEALARRIAIWEAWSRKHGWLADAPRIPGLAYPTWDELEAEWARDAAQP